MMDVAEEIKLAQGILAQAFPTHTFWQSFTRNMSHNSLCSLPLFCSILGPDVTKKSLRKLLVTLGAGCHQKLAQASPHANLSLSMISHNNRT